MAAASPTTPLRPPVTLNTNKLPARAAPTPVIPFVSRDRPLPPPPPEAKVVTVRKDDYESLFYGLWERKSTVDHELSFTCGELLHVVDREYEQHGWLTAMSTSKQVGLVPKVFLTPAYAAC